MTFAELKDAFHRSAHAPTKAGVCLASINQQQRAKDVSLQQRQTCLHRPSHEQHCRLHTVNRQGHR